MTIIQKAPVMMDEPKDWLEAELQDTLDEDVEIELEDAVLSAEIKRIYRDNHPDQMDRKLYFHELLRLQSEMTVSYTHLTLPTKRIV